jgi:hypothetical protein
LGLPSIGIDSNPVAAAIAAAKLEAPSAGAVVRAGQEILSAAKEPEAVPSGEFWRWCYHPDTLRDVCLIREALLEDCGSGRRRALRALMLGCLHGPLTKVTPSHLSNQMPRTYASKPAYAVKFWRAREMKPEKVDVLAVVKQRAERYFTSVPERTRGYIACGDSRTLPIRTGDKKVSWVVTSPPYYGMRTYVPDQWLRYWFLGGPPEVSYSNQDQLGHGSPEAFTDQLGKVWGNVARACADGARMVIRFGGIRDRREDPRDLLRDSIRKADCGWRLRTARSAGVATAGRRQASQFQADLLEPIEESDFYARLDG